MQEVGNNVPEHLLVIWKCIHHIESSCKNCLCILQGSPFPENSAFPGLLNMIRSLQVASGWGWTGGFLYFVLSSFKRLVLELEKRSTNFTHIIITAVPRSVEMALPRAGVHLTTSWQSSQHVEELSGEQSERPPVCPESCTRFSLNAG